MTDAHAPDTAPARSPRIIAMLNQKGGVGKTTTTVNLGAALAREGNRVCLVDMDPQGHLTLHLGIDDDSIALSVYDLLIDPQANAADAVVHAQDNLDAILAETDLAGAEPELAEKQGRQSILSSKFAAIADRYDYVLIDCPPSLGLLTLNALSLADEVFVPMQAHFLALQGVGKLLETVGMVCQSVNPSLRVTGIVLCMHESQTTLAKEIVADLDAFFEQARGQDVPWRDCRVLRPAIRRNIKLAEAPSFGQTIFDYAPWCPGALDYRKLAEQVMQQSQSGAAAPSSGLRSPASLAVAVEPKLQSESQVDTADENDNDPPIVMTSASPDQRQQQPTNSTTAEHTTTAADSNR